MPTREAIIIQQLTPLFQPNQTVLEIGAGNGLVAQDLQRLTGAQFTLLDVVDYNKTTLPMRIYDGKQLPFDNRSFDYSLMVFVLHHNQEPMSVLRQALRVARRGVIVVENDVQGTLKKPLTRVIDSLEHYRHGVPVCYHTKSADQWRAEFQDLPAEVTLINRFPLGIFWKNIILHVTSV